MQPVELVEEQTAAEPQTQPVILPALRLALLPQGAAISGAAAAADTSQQLLQQTLQTPPGGAAAGSAAAADTSQQLGSQTPQGATISSSLEAAAALPMPQLQRPGIRRRRDITASTVATTHNLAAQAQ